MRRPKQASQASGRAPDLRRTGLALSHVWVAAAIVIPAAIVASFPLVAVDLAYLLRAGDLMLDTGTILRTDPLMTWTIGTPWLDQQWVAEIALAATFRAGGWLGLALLRVALQAAVLGFVYLACRAVGADRRRAAFLTLGSAALLLGGFGLRAQLFGMVCFAATLWLVETSPRHPSRLWWVIPIQVVWVNSHGSFPLGPLLLLLAGVRASAGHRSDARRIWLFALATVAATVVGPFGLGVWRYVWDVGTDPQVIDVVREWRPTSLRTVQGALFFASALGAVGFLAMRRPVAPVASLIRLGVFFLLGLTAVRATVWWGVLVAVDVAALLPEPTRRARDPRTPINAVALGVLPLLLAGSLLRWLPHADTDHPGDLLQRAPEGITRTLQSVLEPGERFFHPQEWGSWFELALPENPVVADSRFELIPPERWREYLAISQGRADWGRILDGWGVRVLVLARDQQADLMPIARRDPGWRMVYEDDEGLVLVRT